MAGTTLRSSLLFLCALLVAGAVLADGRKLYPPLKERIVLHTKGAEMEGVLSGCPPAAGTGLVRQAHNYRAAPVLFNSAGARVGTIAASRHNHDKLTAGSRLPAVAVCFQRGEDFLPNTTLELEIAIDGEDEVNAGMKVVARGQTRVERKGDGDESWANMELNSTVLVGETETGVPVTVRIGRAFGLEPSTGVARRVRRAPLPEFVTIRAKVSAEFIIGWPDEVSVRLEPGAGEAETAEVGILSREAFDAATLHREFLTFGPTGLETFLDGCVSRDLDGDGRGDLACRLETASAGFEPGRSEGVLRGITRDGAPVEGRVSVDWAAQSTVAQE